MTSGSNCEKEFKLTTAVLSASVRGPVILGEGGGEYRNASNYNAVNEKRRQRTSLVISANKRNKIVNNNEKEQGGEENIYEITELYRLDTRHYISLLSVIIYVPKT